MKQAWGEIGDMIGDGFTGMTYTTENNPDSSLIFHTYEIGNEHWLTIKESYVGFGDNSDEINTINIVGKSLEELYEFIGKILNK